MRGACPRCLVMVLRRLARRVGARRRQAVTARDLIFCHMLSRGILGPFPTGPLRRSRGVSGAQDGPAGLNARTQEGLLHQIDRPETA